MKFRSDNNYSSSLISMAIVPKATAHPKATAFVRKAVARMLAAPRFFSQKEWNALASYDGPVVSGDPDGRIPDHLGADDNE